MVFAYYTDFENKYFIPTLVPNIVLYWEQVFADYNTCSQHCTLLLITFVYCLRVCPVHVQSVGHAYLHVLTGVLLTGFRCLLITFV